MTSVIYFLLDNAFEFVPINEHLQKLFQNEELYKDFYLFRAFNDTLFMSSYLPMGIGAKCIEGVIQEKAEEGLHEKLIYSMIENAPFQVKIHPLLVSTHQYLAEMISGMKDESEWVRNISYAPASIFEYNGRDELNYFLTDLKTGIRYEVDKDSSEIDSEVPIGKPVMTELVRYREKWMVNGSVSAGNLEEAVEKAKGEKRQQKFSEGFMTIL